MNLRTKTLSSVIGLSLIGIAISAVGTLDAWHNRNEAVTLEEASDALAQLSAATIELSLDRSVTQVALALDDPIPANLRDLSATQRRLSDQHFDKAAELASHLDTSEQVGTFITELGTARETVARLRAEADTLTGVPRAQRPADRILALPKELKAAVLNLQSLPPYLRGNGHEVPTDVAILERLQERAWQMREFGGRERTYMVIAVARGEPIPIDTRAEMSELHLRVLEAWTDIKRLSEISGFPVPLKEQISAIEANYFGAYQQTREAVLAASGNADPAYPLAMPAFFEQSGAALAELEALLPLAGDEIKAYWRARAEASLRVLVLDIAMVLVFFLGAVFTGWLVAASFRRFDDLRTAMEELAEGNLETTVPYVGETNEVGRMAGTVAVFKNSLLENRSLSAHQAEESEAKVRRALALETLTGDFDRAATAMCERLASAASRMEETAGTMGDVAKLTNQKSMEVVSAAEETAANVQTVASSTEELSASIEEITSQANRSSSAANAARETIGATRQKVAILDEMAARIGSVVQLITDIAGQTNLLALNATIEAARAGEAGKGFAVVASEVKQLANQTSKATDEIASQIGAMQTSTSEMVRAIEAVASMIGELASVATEVNASMEQQRIATGEIARGVQEAALGTGEVTRNINDVQSGAQRTGTASEEVLTAARDLAKSAADLRSRIGSYLTDVKAA